MELAKLKSILERELNERKLYKDALDVITTVEGLDQNKRELEAALAKLNKEVLKAEIALADHENLIGKAQAEAFEIVAKAELQADSVRAKAAADVHEAQQKAEEKADKAAAHVKALEAKSKKLEEEIAAKADELEKLVDGVKQAKEKLAKFLG